MCRRDRPPTGQRTSGGVLEHIAPFTYYRLRSSVDHLTHCPQPSFTVKTSVQKTKGIILGIAAAAFIWIQRQRGRPRQKATGPRKAWRPRSKTLLQNRQTNSNHTCYSVINCTMSVTDPRGRHQTSRGSKRSQPICCKQKPPTTAHEIDKQWTPILQSHHEGCIRHANQHCHKSPNSTKHTEAHTTRDGTANRRRMELSKSGHQSGRKR